MKIIDADGDGVSLSWPASESERSCRSSTRRSSWTDLVVKLAERFRRGGGEPVLDGFDLALHAGERRAEFVGDIADHVAAQLLGVGEAVGHGVEGDGEAAEFVAALRRDALIEAALGDVGRRRR